MDHFKTTNLYEKEIDWLIWDWFFSFLLTLSYSIIIFQIFIWRTIPPFLYQSWLSSISLLRCHYNDVLCRWINGRDTTIHLASNLEIFCGADNRLIVERGHPLMKTRNYHILSRRSIHIYFFTYIDKLPLCWVTAEIQVRWKGKPW